MLKELTLKKYQICERRRVHSEVLQLTCDQAFLSVKSYRLVTSYQGQHGTMHTS